MGAITLGRLVSRTIYSNVASGASGLPTVASINQGGSIASFTLKGTADGASLISSSVAAWKLGSVSVNDVTVWTWPYFGFAAHEIDSITVQKPSPVLSLKKLLGPKSDSSPKSGYFVIRLI